MRSRRGFTLLEMLVAATISIAVLAAGYQAYTGFMRADDIEARRESMNLGTQYLMNQIKGDVRAGSSVNGTKDSLVISGPNGAVTYRNLRDGSGIEKLIAGRRVKYRDIVGEFSTSNGGSNIMLRSKANVHRRPITVEISSYIRPRNR